MRNALRRKSASGNFGCVGMAAAFLLVGLLTGGLFAVRAWRDVRTFTVWRPATCTILDKTISSTGGSGRSKPSYRPDITFRYEVGAKEYRCTGWDSWALAGDYGGGSSRYYERVLDRYEVGRAYPCWYDPSEPNRAVLVRHVRGLYILAVLPIAFTVLGAVGVWATLASPRRRGGGAADDAHRASRAGHDRGSPDALLARQRLAIRLRPESTPGGESCGALFVAAALLFVGGIAGYAAWADLQDETWHVLPILFVVVFGGLGLVFLWIAAVAALSMRVPETIVEVERSTIAPGESTRMLVLQPGPVRLRRLLVRLTCREEVPQQEGSPQVTVVHDEVVTEVGRTSVGPDVPLEHPAELRIPTDAKPSSGGTPAVRWRVEVWGVPLVWPRFTLTFPIMVEQVTLGAESHEPNAATD